MSGEYLSDGSADHIPGVEASQLPSYEDTVRVMKYRFDHSDISERVGKVEEFPVVFQYRGDQDGSARYGLSGSEIAVDLQQEYQGIREVGLSPSQGDVQITMEGGATRQYNILGLLEGRSVLFDEQRRVLKYDHREENLYLVDFERNEVDLLDDDPFTELHAAAIEPFHNALFRAHREEHSEELTIQGSSAQYFKSLINNIVPMLKTGPFTIQNTQHFGTSRAKGVGRDMQKAINHCGDYIREEFDMDPENIEVNMNKNRATIRHMQDE